MDFSIKKIFTIPNIISFIRLGMIPFIVFSIVKWENTILAVLLILISALTDIVDGKIARRFDMTSELGKALDPIADKLTLIALFFSCALMNKYMFALGVILVIKEIIMAVTSLLAAKCDKKIHSAVWHGKLCTVLSYCLIVIVMLFPNIPPWIINSGIVICCALMIYSLVMYVKERISIIKKTGFQ